MEPLNSLKVPEFEVVPRYKTRDAISTNSEVCIAWTLSLQLNSHKDDISVLILLDRRWKSYQIVNFFTRK